MISEDKLARDLAKIEQAQQQARASLDKAQAKIDKTFDRMREKLLKKYGQPSSSQQRIIRAALELLKQEGLSRLSLRKLAKTLDMQAPALYWHFKSKDMLVDFLAEAILQSGYTDMQPRKADEPWQEWLIAHMNQLRAAMLMYPDGARIVAGAHLDPAFTLAKIGEVGLASLMSAGLDANTARHIVLTATHYTFGHVIEEQAAPTPDQLNDFDMDTFMQPFPHLQKAIAAAMQQGIDPDTEFNTGLRYIIKGATALAEPA